MEPRSCIQQAAGTLGQTVIAQPFNELGIVPVRYRKALSDTIFADDYIHEKYSVYIDNINLLYVAMTRAKDAIYGFAPERPGTSETIARVIKDAISHQMKIRQEIRAWY